MECTPAYGTLEQTPGGRWCLGAGGTLLKEDQGQWNSVLDTDDTDSWFADITERSDGVVFVSHIFSGHSTGSVHRLNPDQSYVTDDFDFLVYALATTESDTVWAAGGQLSYFAESAWHTAVTIPDGNLVVAIGQPPDGSLILVCINGAIYRWQSGALTSVHESGLSGSLGSVCYIDETMIYGCRNHTDDDTGHETGTIVRFDGTQWVTVFLVPPV